MKEETYRRIFKSGPRYEAFSDAKSRESVLEALAVRLNDRLPDIGYEEAVRYASIIIERAADFTRCEDYLDGSDTESVYRRIVEYADGEDESVRCDIFRSIISMLYVGANVTTRSIPLSLSTCLNTLGWRRMNLRRFSARGSADFLSLRLCLSVWLTTFLPSKVTYITCCNYCHTQFTYQQEDITYSSDGYNQEYRTIRCPFCSRTVYLPEHGVPYTKE